MDLTGARSFNRTFNLVEGQAGLVPLKAAVSQYAARLCFEIGDEILVTYFQHHSLWKNLAPMVHQPLVGLVRALLTWY